MVQRNKPTNLNLFQPSDHHHHHLKSVKKMLINPSSPTNLEDTMNRGPSDLNNNKMKKSRSNFSKEVPEPGKPPSSSPPPPPNYMKSTSSFDAKKDSLKNLRKTTSFKSPRSSTKKNPSVLINRDTCSSTLKDSKFPTFLELNHGSTQLEGTSIFKVCHYTYCSLNGHHHRNPPLPPLNRFISSKRQTLKTSCLSPPPEPEIVDDHDIPTTDNESEQPEALEGQILKTHQTSYPVCLEIPSTDKESEQSEALEMKMEAEVSGEIDNLDEILEEFNVEKSIDEMSGHEELKKEDEVQRIDVDHLKIVKSDKGLEEMDEQKGFNVEKSIDEMSGHGQLKEDDEVQRIDLDHLKIVKSDKGLEEMDEQKGFNPKEPNYLDVESEPEAEKVDLKHQELDDKKNSEEWMLDYAIQQAVNKLGSARKKRVGLLVEAFEKVIPIHHQFDRSISSPVALNHSRPIIQACI